MKSEHLMKDSTFQTSNDVRQTHVAFATKPDTRLPSVDEFLSLVEDETKETALNPSGYSVYHKYNKSC